MSLQYIYLILRRGRVTPPYYSRFVYSADYHLIFPEALHATLRYNSTVRCHIAEPPLKAGGVTAVP